MPLICWSFIQKWPKSYQCDQIFVRYYSCLQFSVPLSWICVIHCLI